MVLFNKYLVKYKIKTNFLKIIYYLRIRNKN